MLTLEFHVRGTRALVNTARVTYVDHASGKAVPAVLRFTCPPTVHVLSDGGRPSLAVRRWCDVAAQECGVEALGTDEFHFTVDTINGAPFAW